jgi:hypothetical protein
MAMDAECSFILMLLAPTETELLDGQICPPDSIQQSFFDDFTTLTRAASIVRQAARIEKKVRRNPFGGQLSYIPRPLHKYLLKTLFYIYVENNLRRHKQVEKIHFINLNRNTIDKDIQKQYTYLQSVRIIMKTMQVFNFVSELSNLKF